MGLFRRVIGAVARPYTRIGGDVAKTIRNVGGQLSQAKAEAVKPASPVRRIVQLKGSKEAFRILCDERGWTPEMLAEQAIGVHRAKWAGLTFSWLSICLGLGFALFGPDSLYRYWGAAGALLMLLNFALRALKFSLFEEQLRRKDLISMQQFIHEPKLWLKIFS